MFHFDNWIIEVTGEPLVRQYDNKTRTIAVTGDIPREWDWDLLVQVDEAMDVLPLSFGDDGLYLTLTAQQLSISGWYKMQLRATQGEMVKHTNVIARVYIPPSLSGDANWPEIPSEFTDLEKRVKADADRAEEARDKAESFSSHPPIVGVNGNWMEWDGEGYVDTGKPSQGAPGKDGVAGRGIESISYDRNKGVWRIRYTDNTYQTFSGIDPLTGKFVYFNDNFVSYPYTTADGMIEKNSDFRYYGNIKTARFIGSSLEMSAVGSSKNTTDSVGVYYSGKPVMGEVVIEFDFRPTVQGGKNTPFLEVRLFNSKIWCRLNRVGLNWWCVSTASGLDIPSTPVADRLAFNYELRTTYRVKITVKDGELAVKSWKSSEDEPLTDYDNTIYLFSNLIDKQLLSEQYEPLFVFGQINDISNPNASFACQIDNYTAYKV